jgi:hypothetical protein
MSLVVLVPAYLLRAYGQAGAQSPVITTEPAKWE